MSSIIDKSEHFRVLAVAPGDSLTIERDGGTPKNEDRVHVTAEIISLGLGSTITVAEGGVLAVKGVASLSVIGTFAIADGGTLKLVSGVGLEVGSTIAFTGHTETTSLVLGQTNINLLGGVSGFGAHDTIRIPQLDASSLGWAQSLGSGILSLYDAQGAAIDTIHLDGTYTAAAFDLHVNAGGSSVSYAGSDQAVAPYPDQGPPAFGHGFAASGIL